MARKRKSKRGSRRGRAAKESAADEEDIPEPPTPASGPPGRGPPGTPPGRGPPSSPAGRGPPRASPGTPPTSSAPMNSEEHIPAPPNDEFDDEKYEEFSHDESDGHSEVAGGQEDEFSAALSMMTGGDDEGGGLEENGVIEDDGGIDDESDEMEDSEPTSDLIGRGPPSPSGPAGRGPPSGPPGSGPPSPGSPPSQRPSAPSGPPGPASPVASALASLGGPDSTVGPPTSPAGVPTPASPSTSPSLPSLSPRGPNASGPGLPGPSLPGPSPAVPTEVEDYPVTPVVVDLHGTDDRKPMQVTVEEIGVMPDRTPLNEIDPDAAPREVVIPPRQVTAPAGTIYDGLPDTERIGHIVPHTHWDRAWYLPFQKFRYKLVEMMDDLLDLLEQNPETYPSFELDGQTIVLEDYLEIRPENASRITALVEEERLSIGPWYVLPDEYLAGGEGLIRNLIRGRRIAESYGGCSSVGYVPDPFGHVSQMPAILTGCGLDSFIFTRGAGPWIQDARGIFKWYSPDGQSKVLAIKQAPDYPNLMAWGFEDRPLDAKDSADVDVDTAMAKLGRLLKIHETKYWWKPPHMLFGNGSDHTKAQTTLPMLIEEANKKFRGEVTFKHSSFATFVSELTAWLGRKKVYRYDGELHHGWDRNILSGVFSARMYLKRMNDHTMRLLTQQVEPLACISWQNGGRHRGRMLDLSWREVLRNHPHDDICGCSVDEVHMDMEDRFRHSQEVSSMLVDSVTTELREGLNLHHIDRDAVPIIVHNPLTVNWSGTLPLDEAVPSYRCWLDSGMAVGVEMARPIEGCQLHADVTLGDSEWQMHYHDDRAVNVELPRIKGRLQFHDLPPGLHVLHALPGHKPSTLPDRPVEVEMAADRVLSMENGHVRVEFSLDGRFDLTDISTGRTFPGIGRLEDSEDAGDSYDWSPAGHPVEINGRASEKLDYRVQPAGRRLHDRDGVAASAAVGLQHSDEWSATIRINIQWTLPAKFDDETQRRSEETSTVSVDHFLTLRVGSRTVEVESWIDNQCEDHRLRLMIPTGMNTTQSIAGSVFDVVTRPTMWPHDPTWEQPMVPTQHCHQFVAVESDDQGTNEGGIALLVPGSNEYEVGLADDADVGGYDIALTLVRSCGWLSRDGFAHRQNRAGPCIQTPGAQCLGSSFMRWAVRPYDSDWATEGIHQEAEKFAAQISLISVLGKPQINGFFDDPLSTGVLGARFQPVRLEGPAPLPILAACKPSEDGGAVIIRLWNPTDSEWQGNVITDLPCNEIHQCDMLENPRKKNLKADRGAWDVKIPSRSIRQWRVA
jgi:mannosylglycerate hydrolase